MQVEHVTSLSGVSQIRFQPDPPWEVVDVLQETAGGTAESILSMVKRAGAGPLSWMLAPGLGTRTAYTVKVRKKDKQKELTSSVLSPSHLYDFRALPGDGEVRLSWSAYEWKSEDWVEEPEIVISRKVYTGAPQLGPRGFTHGPPLAEVHRCPVSAGTWTDTSVANSTVYAYAPLIEGTIRATASSIKHGPHEVLVPCRVPLPADLRGQRPEAVANPGPRGPLKVGVTALDRGKDARGLRRAETELRRALGRLAWVQLVERQQADVLFDERTVGSFSQARRPGVGAAAAGVAVPGVGEAVPGGGATAVDAILRCTVRLYGGRKLLDVSLIDHRNSWQRRIASQPCAGMAWGRLAAEVVRGLAAAFPGCDAAAGNDQAPASGAARSIAMLGFRPAAAAAGTGVPTGALDDMVELALAEHERWHVVERQKLDQVMKELGLTGGNASGSALRLGKLLQADVVLTGTYELAQGKLALTVRPLDVKTGVQLGSVEVSGAMADIQGLAAQLADSLAELRADPGKASPLALREIDAQASAMSADRLVRMKQKAFVNPEDADALEQVGREYQNRGNLEEAVNSYRRAIEVRTQRGQFFRCRPACEAVDRCLRRLGRPGERVTLWQQALARQSQQPPQSRFGVVWLAEALRDAGKPDEARAVLRQPPHLDERQRANALSEQLGVLQNPLAKYVQAPWWQPCSGGNRPWYGEQALGSAYAAVIRLLPEAQPEERCNALMQIVQRLVSDRPRQALRAAAELQALGQMDLRTAARTVKAAARMNDTPECKRWFKVLVSREEATEECVAAFAEAASQLYKCRLRKAAEMLAKRVLAIEVTSAAAEWKQTQMKQLLAGEMRVVNSRDSRAPEEYLDEAVRAYVKEDGGRRLGQDICVLTEWGVLARLRLPDLREVWRAELGFRRPFPRLAKSASGRRLDLKNLNNTMWITEDLLVVPNIPDGVVHAIDVGTGRPRWSYTAWTAVSPPVVRADLGWVSVADAFGRLLMLSLEDGALIRTINGPPGLEDTYCERPPDLRAFLVPHADGSARQTEWLQYTRSSQGFQERNFGSLRKVVRYRSRPLGGSHRFNIDDHTMRGADSPAVASSDLPSSDLPVGGASDVSGGASSEMPGRAPSGIPREARSDMPEDARVFMDRSRSDDARRWALARSKGSEDALELVPFLKQLMNDGTEQMGIRYSAFSSLATNSPGEAAALIETFVADSDHPLRASAISILKIHITRMGAGGRAGFRTEVSQDVVNPLVRLSRNPDKEVRRSAMLALVNCLGKEARPFVGEILKDQTAPERGTVAMRLGEDGDRSVLPILKSFIREDVSIKKQVGVLQVLSRLGDADSTRRLEAVIDFDAELKQAQEAMQRGVTHADIRRAQTTLQKISDYGLGVTAVPFLREMLPLLDGKIGASVCRTLATIDDPEIVPLLIDLLPVKQTAVNAADWRMGPGDVHGASAALEQITGYSWGVDRPRWERWYREKQREEAKSPSAAAGT